MSGEAQKFDADVARLQDLGFTRIEAIAQLIADMPGAEATPEWMLEHGEGKAENEAPNAPVMELRWFQDCELRTIPATVAQLIADNSLVLIYGISGCGKSTLALDIELAIARGIPWRGLQTQAGIVVHICGEGTHGVQQRLIAYAQKNDVKDVPLAIVPGAVQLLDGTQITLLIDTLRAVAKERGPIKVVTFDTLARCLAGDENDSRDMAAAIAAADRIRNALGCVVILIHHAGKDPAKGARGHSSLRAAVDTEILIEQEGEARTATVMKQRDLPTHEPFGFSLEAIEIGRDDGNNPILACVVNHNEQAVAIKQPETRGKAQRQLLAALRARMNGDQAKVWTIGDMRTVGREAGMHKNTSRAAVEGLITNGLMTATIGGYRLTSA